VLKQPAVKITNVDDSLVSLITDMNETLYSARGVGLAAPQVGAGLSLILVDPTGKADSGQLKVILNPEIIEAEGREVDSEMCLSVPEFAVEIARATRILVKGTDLEGHDLRIEAEGFLARIFQHEIDHLKGTCIMDHASTLKRGIYLKKLKKGKI
jgi:peptide deformylase